MSQEPVSGTASAAGPSGWLGAKPEAKADAEIRRRADWEKGLQLFALFVTTLVGISLKALPMGAVAMIGIAATALTGTLSIADSMSGFSNLVIWLIWRLGLFISPVNIVIWVGIGGLWWKVLGL